MTGPGGLFLFFLALYGVYALASNPRRDESQRDHTTTLGLLLQGPLFALACYHGWMAGIFDRDWVSPLSIGAGLVLGHGVFCASLLVTHRSVGTAWRQLRDAGGALGFVRDHPEPLFRTFGVAVSEELIYRGTAQPLLIGLTGQAWLGIGLVAVAFSVVHWHFFRNPRPQSAEFLAFSALLGALYYATGSIMLVVVVHTVRNVEIAYLEHRIALEEESGETGTPRPPGEAARAPRLA